MISKIKNELMQAIFNTRKRMPYLPILTIPASTIIVSIAPTSNVIIELPNWAEFFRTSAPNGSIYFTLNGNVDTASTIPKEVGMMLTNGISEVYFMPENTTYLTARNESGLARIFVIELWRKDGL